MKTKALKGVGLLAVALGFALTPSFNVMALEDGSIDYGGNVDQINQQSTTNMLVQATNDGGYVIAGITGECYGGGGPVEGPKSVAAAYYGGCSCEDPDMELNISDDVLSSKADVICGYVVKYKADGTEVWHTDLALQDYPSMNLVSGYYYDSDAEDYVPYTQDYTHSMPIQLKETSAGIGMMTGDADYFLFDANNGDIIDSYSLIEVIDNSDEECVSGDDALLDCYDAVEWYEPYWTNINSDGSTTLLSDKDDKLYKKTSGETQTKINYSLPLYTQPVTTQDKVYVVECVDMPGNIMHEGDSEIELYESESCELVRMDENFQNRKAIEIPTDDEFYLAGASDQLVSVVSLSESYNEETGHYIIENAGAYIIKDTDIIAKTETVGINYDTSSEEIPEELKVIQVLEISAFSGGATDMVETSDGIAVALYYGDGAGVITFDSNLKVLDEIELDMSNDDVQYNDLAFLRDGSLTAAGADNSASDYYNIDGDQNGMHVHYSSVITPNENGSSSDGQQANPNTLDNVIVFGVGLIAMFSTAGCAAKRLVRRR